MKSSILVSTILFFSLRQVLAQPSDNLVRCLIENEFDSTVDYFPSKFKVTNYTAPVFANTMDAFPDKVETDPTTDLFSITYHNYYKVVTNHFVNKSYLLYMCGIQPPESELDGRHHLVLPVPHQGGIGLTETTQIPYLELLGLRREVKGYIGDPQYISSPCMLYQKDVEDSIQVYDHPDSYSNQTIFRMLKKDFLENNPQGIIFGGPYGDADGDRTVIAASTQERSTVATFDWIGYYAAFFNLEGLSNEIASETKSSFECASSNAATLSKGRRDEELPIVLWATYFEGYNWSVAECPTWDHTYYCEYATHCGAHLISRPEGFGWNNPDFGGRYWYVNDDQLLELGKDADVFIYPSWTWDTVYEKKKDTLDQIKAVQNKKVYDTQGQGRNSWHEQRLAEYEVVALDFCDLVGNSIGDSHERRWFRNVFNEPVGSLGSCNAPEEIGELYKPDGAECTLIVDGGSNVAGDDDPETSGTAASDGYPARCVSATTVSALVISMFSITC